MGWPCWPLDHRKAFELYLEGTLREGSGVTQRFLLDRIVTKEF